MWDERNIKQNKVIAVLSTSVMPKDGLYSIKTVDRATLCLEGLPHYIGHPCTKRIVEKLGAYPSKSRTFRGLKPGEEAICVPIKHTKNKREHHFTRANQKVSVEDLCFRILKRIK